MQNEPTNYEQAMTELESIVERVENKEMNIDDLTSMLNRAQTLIKFCRSRLLKTEEEVQKILSSDQSVLKTNTPADNNEAVANQDEDNALPF